MYVILLKFPSFHLSLHPQNIFKCTFFCITHTKSPVHRTVRAYSLFLDLSRIPPSLSLSITCHLHVCLLYVCDQKITGQIFPKISVGFDQVSEIWSYPRKGYNSTVSQPRTSIYVLYCSAQSS